MLTKKQAVKLFKDNILPAVINVNERDGMKDWPGRRLAWNTFVDGLQRDGQISEAQRLTWDQPRCVKGGK